MAYVGAIGSKRRTPPGRGFSIRSNQVNQAPGDIVNTGKDYGALAAQNQDINRRIQSGELPQPGEKTTYHIVDEQGNLQINKAFDPGYAPSYWEDPRHVAVMYHRYKSLPPGTPPPEWMDTDGLEAAYKYLQYANGESSWVNWKYLNPNDPGRQFLQSLPMPPLNEVLEPNLYNQAMVYQQLQLAPEERDPNVISQLPPDYQAYLQADTEAQNQQKAYEEHAPWWMKAANTVMDNPITGALFQTVPLGGAAVAMGGPAAIPFALATTASGVGIGYSQKLQETHPYLADALAGASALTPWGMMLGTMLAGPPGTAIGGALGFGLGGLGGWAYGQLGLGDILAKEMGWKSLTGNRAADAAMALLDAPAEAIDRILGVAIQYDLAQHYPQKYGAPAEVLKNFGAAWKAGSLTEESGALYKWMRGEYGPSYKPYTPISLDVADALGGSTGGHSNYVWNRIQQNPFNILPALNEIALNAGLVKGNLEDIKYIDPNQTFQYGYIDPVNLNTVGAAALVEARRRIAKGEDPYNVLMEYKAMFGLPGNTSELVGHMILDPLNRWGEFTKYGAATLAKVAGKPMLAESLASPNVSGVGEGIKFYKQRLMTTPLDDLSAWDQKLIGWDNATQGWKINQPTAKTANPLARIFDFQRTPEAAVRSHINDTQTLLPSLLTSRMQMGDVDGMTEVFRRGSSNPPSAQEDASLRLLETPLGIASSRAFDSFYPKADAERVRYHEADPIRSVLYRLSDITGEKDVEILKRIGSTDGAEALMRDLETRLQAIDSDEARGLLEEMHPADGSPPRFTGEQLKALDIFNGTDAVPKNPQEFAAKLVSDYTTHSTELLIDTLGVGSKHWAMQIVGSLKALQSAALLSVNAGYVLPHIFLNPATILASGAGGGFFTPATIREKFWKDFGFKPYRLHAGSGMAGAPETEVLGVKSAGGAEKALRKARQGKGLLAEAEQALNKIQRYGPASIAAEKLEQSQGAAALYAFTKKTWDALIPFGRKYTPLETTLRTQLEAVDPTWTTRIDNAIRNNISIEGVLKDIFGKELRVDLAGAMDELSSILKLDPRIISETLDAYPGLVERIRGIDSPEKIDPIFDDIFNKIEDTHDLRIGQEVQTKVEQVKAQVGSGKAAEAFRVIDEKTARAEEFYIRHQQLMIDAFKKMDDMKLQGVSDEAIQTYWKGVRALSSRMFSRMETIDYGALQGLFEGLDLEKAGSKKYLGDVVSEYKRWQGFYDLSDELWNKFFKNRKSYKTATDKQIAYDAVRAQLREAYTRSFEDIAHRQSIMDADLSEMMRVKYGNDAAIATKQWRDSIATFVQERGRLINAERDAMDAIKNVDDQRAEWIRFANEDLLPLVRDHYNLDHAGTRHLWQVVTGMEPPEALMKQLPLEPQPQATAPKPSEVPTPETVPSTPKQTPEEWTRLDQVEDATYMSMALDLIDQPGKSGVVIPTAEGTTRLASGYPDWFEKYEWKKAEYHGETGLKALRKAINYFIEHDGVAELRPNGKPYAIFDRIQKTLTGEGSERIIASAMEKPSDVLAEREERLGRAPVTAKLSDADLQYVKDQGLFLAGTDSEQGILNLFNKNNQVEVDNIRDIAQFDNWKQMLDEALNLERLANRYGMSSEEYDVYLAKCHEQLKKNGKRTEIPKKVNPLPEGELEPRPMTAEELATGEPLGELPPSVVEDIAPVQRLGEIGADAWYDQVKPALESLRDVIKRKGLTGGGDLPPELREKVNTYVTRTIAGDYATAKAAAAGYGTAMRDYSLVNYSDQRGIDNWLTAMFPYQFWLTRSMLNWMMRAWDHPAWFANYYRMRKFMQSAQTKPGFPTRLRDTMAIPAPFLPEWAGGNLYFDPLQNIFPMDQFFNGIEMLTQNYTQQERDAQTILFGWKNEGQISQAEMEDAIRTKQGDAWSRAMAQAKLDESEGKYNPFQFIQMFMGPALYLTYPYFLMSGQKNKMSVTPLTRTGQALQAATEGSALQGLGQFIGKALAFPETAFRKAVGVSEFGEWGDYSIERELANMVGDGTANLKDAQKAMIEHAGPLYDEARKRVMFQTAARVPGAMPTYAIAHGALKDPAELGAALLFGVFPASILPKGELVERGLYDEYKATGDAYRSGDREAYNRFFEAHPEYQARLALFDEPDERLRQFMISEIWDKWSEMGSTQKQLFREAVGEDFQDYFLNDETRNYELVDIETLAAWSKMAGGLVPQTPQTQGVIEDKDINTDALTQATPEVYAEVDAYRKLRNQLFPNHQALQERYFGMPPGDERKAFVAQFPELKTYWDWNRSYKVQHPNVEKYVTIPEEQDMTPTFDYAFVKEITPVLARQLYSYFYADKKLSDGALAELNRIWRKYNKVGGEFPDFLDAAVKSVIAPEPAPQ